MQRCMYRLCLCIIALPFAWGFPFFEVSDQNGALYVSWNGSVFPDAFAYEFEYQLLGENLWRQLSFPGGTLQQLVVRVDAGCRIDAGSFTVGHSGPQPELRKTATIAFDATGEVVLTALRRVIGDTNGIEVYRCDEEFSLQPAVSRAHGAKACAQASQGAFSWYILAYRSIPELQILEVELDGRWSGSGAQVSFKHLHPGIIHASHCDPLCTIGLTDELDPVQYYSLRVSAEQPSRGWMQVGTNSPFQPLVDTSLPKRLPKPEIISSSETTITLVLERKAVDFDSTYTVQLTPTAGHEAWRAASTAQVQRNGSTVIVEIANLDSGVEYKFRARRETRYGAGPYSTPSIPVETTPIAEPLPDGAFVEGGRCVNATLLLGVQVRGFPTGQLDLQYKQATDNSWNYLPDYQVFQQGSMSLALPISGWEAIYQVRVRASLENRMSEWSDIATIKGCAPYAADPTAAPIVRAKPPTAKPEEPTDPTTPAGLVRPIDLHLLDVQTRSATFGWQLPAGERCDIQEFEIQLAVGNYSEDFRIVGAVKTRQATLRDLQTKQTYRVRTRVLCKRLGYGPPSEELLFRTLAELKNLWQTTAGVPRKLSWYGHGIDLPYGDRPGEVLEEVRGPNIRTDPPTPEVPDLPDPRRGASFTAHATDVYMFGGRSTAKGCSFSDLTSIDRSQAGLPLSTCNERIGVVDEFWRLDPILYEWEFLQSHQNPPARERHSAAVVGSRLLVFGGHDGVVPLSDLWEIELPNLHTLDWSGTPAPIEAHTPAVSTISISDIDLPEQLGSQSAPYCIADMKLRVDIRHPCAQELAILLSGPGPNTGSVNFFPSSSDYEVLVLKENFANNAFCVPDLRNVTFQQNQSQSLAVYFRDAHDSRAFRPEWSFEGFYGNSPVGDWTLTVIDAIDDGNEGELISWDLSFTLGACNPTYTWHNKTSTSASTNWPLARYDHIALQHGNSMFIYSGRDHGSHALGDLWRYDVLDERWIELAPVPMNGWHEIVEWGLTPVLTPRGIVAVTEDCSGLAASCRRLVLQDPFTEKWETVDNLTASQKHAAVTFISPRKLRAAQTPWFAEYSGMKDFKFDRLLWFGGGSGMIPRNYHPVISTLWLQSWSHDVEAFQSYLRQHCGWRFASSWLSKFEASCMATTKERCPIRDIVHFQLCLEEL